MTWDLLIESDCVPVPLRAGAHVTCRAGQLWITVEHRRARPSADIVLAAGQQCRVEEDGVYFLSALRAPGAGAVQCHITPAARQHLVLRPA
ncbi:DUF2917 domain-containing protein [Cupriavidus pauculus]|uniref:DUF2917 domain-containing protein n=1 Tax=Cupriavidus pauculus TaxID=82633 RepID=A0A2N5C7L8_9BURK|nr:DUF2917 domain-containing protein [Cupriavidus pauculus]PLP98180.1 hypothetical protein CYJ10_23985 [Cupriavidus pauculus]